jgi:hypothetical protein
MLRTAKFKQARKAYPKGRHARAQLMLPYHVNPLFYVITVISDRRTKAQSKLPKGDSS